MCLITKQTTPFIAEEDITVYKFLTRVMYAPYNNFHYELGVLYEQEICESNEFSGYDEEACSAYNAEFGGYWLEGGAKSYGKGFHSIILKERFDRSEEGYCDVYICTIPKGAEYYLDSTGLAVSNQIIINKLYEPE